jgi:acetate kinase
MAIEMAKRGFDVTASDLSTEMLTEAEFKARDAATSIRFVSSDMRSVVNEIATNENGHAADAELAYDILIYGIKKYIGAYAAAMGGLDCVVFTGGIGENDALLRAAVCENMEFLGISIDAERNKLRGLDVNDLTAEGAKVKVLVVCTDEEMMIARDTLAIASAQ